MRKLAMQIGDDIHEEKPRSRLPLVLVILVLLIGCAPLAIEGGSLCLATWKEFLGMPATVRTPVLDSVTESWSTAAGHLPRPGYPLVPSHPLGPEHGPPRRRPRDGRGDAAAPPMIARNSGARGSRRAGAAPTPPRSACPDSPLARTRGHAIALTSDSVGAFTLRVSVSPREELF